MSDYITALTGGSEPAVLNRDGWLCGHCLEPAPDTTTTNT